MNCIGGSLNHSFYTQCFCRENVFFLFFFQYWWPKCLQPAEEVDWLLFQVFLRFFSASTKPNAELIVLSIIVYYFCCRLYYCASPIKSERPRLLYNNIVYQAGAHVVSNKCPNFYWHGQLTRYDVLVVWMIWLWFDCACSDISHGLTYTSLLTRSR